MSGRPGSNRPPRPWQGRALPNELLPLIKKCSTIPIAIGRATSACYLKPIKELEGCKNKQRALLKKIFEPLICIWECIRCFPALSLQACQNAWYKAYNNHLKRKLQYRPPAGKIKMLRKMSNCKKSPCHVLSGVPLDIPADTSYRVICGAKISVQQLN